MYVPVSVSWSVSGRGRYLCICLWYVCVGLCLCLNLCLVLVYICVNVCVLFVFVRIRVLVCIWSWSTSMYMSVFCLYVSVLVSWSVSGPCVCGFGCVCVCVCLQRFLYVCVKIDMGWLRLVGSLRLQVSFAEYRLFSRALLQKRPTILRSLLIVATPYAIWIGLNTESAWVWQHCVISFNGQVSFAKESYLHRAHLQKRSDRFSQSRNRSHSR